MQIAYHNKQALRPYSSDYMQTHISNVHSDYSLQSYQTTINPAISGFTSENEAPTSLSPKASHDSLLEANAYKLDDKRKKQSARKGFQQCFTRNSTKQVDSVIQSSMYDPVSVQNEIQHCGNQLQSPNLKESSSMNFRPEEISLEATSFSQLQQVMEQVFKDFQNLIVSFKFRIIILQGLIKVHLLFFQLDLRTKLCIRDSLYRLARSAEQRHNNATLNGSSNSSGAFIATGSNKYAITLCFMHFHL